MRILLLMGLGLLGAWRLSEPWVMNYYCDKFQVLERVTAPLVTFPEGPS